MVNLLLLLSKAELAVSMRKMVSRGSEKAEKADIPREGRGGSSENWDALICD